MVQLYIVGMVPGDSYTFEALREIKRTLNPSIIGVEETQDDIDTLMNPAYSDKYVSEREEYFKENHSDANDKTLKDLLADEICFYKQLNRYKFDGISILGLDDADFDSSGFENAEDIYSERKDRLLSRILSLGPEQAKELIQAEYDAVLKGYCAEELRPYFVVSDSEPLKEYYEARDRDTAERLRELVVEERSGEGSDDSVIVYLCNISHFDGGYQNLVKNLEGFEPEIMRMCDFL